MSFDNRYHGAKNVAIESFIEQPIHCGYLLLFCGSQYCCENLHFAMEVERFRDIFPSDDASFGQRYWREIDEVVQIKNLPPSEPDIDIALFYQTDRNDLWPSSVVGRHAAEGYVQYIWDKFLSDSSISQICMSGMVLQNTIKRLKLLHIYGKEVFSEALIDPMKTMRKDVMPRFLNSEIYQELVRQVDSCRMLPAASTLIVPYPKTDALVDSLTQKDLDSGLTHLDVIDIMNDRMLYEEFLLYLRSTVSSENLLCMRLIVMYKNSFTEYPPPSQSASSERAWQIYKYFIAPGSAYEVSVSHRRRKQTEVSTRARYIMCSNYFFSKTIVKLIRNTFNLCHQHYLANPKANSLGKVEKSVLSALRVHFKTYMKSNQFLRTVSELQQRGLQNQYNKNKAASGCFLFRLMA